jgi:hypothetical protein
MSIVPEGENLRRAVKWISDEEQTGSPKNRRQLTEEACVKFNLTPMEEEYLIRSLKDMIK